MIIVIDILKAIDIKKITLAEAAGGLNISIEDMEALYKNWKGLE